MAVRVWAFLAASTIVLGLSAPLHGQVFGVPNSDKVLMGELVLPNGSSVKFGSRDGTMVTVQDEELGFWYGFQAALERENGQPIVKLWDIINGNEAHQIGTGSPLNFGSAEEFRTKYGSFLFRVDQAPTGNFPQIRLVDPRQSRPPEFLKLYGTSGGGICCVTCGYTTTCATVVEAECGSCTAGFATVQRR
jgi:hypothetical protein